MKESDDGTDRQASGKPASTDPKNSKADKDMKGLVFQGGGPPDAPTGEAPYSAEPEQKEELNSEKGEEAGAMAGEAGKEGKEQGKDDSILTFTEKDNNKGKLIVLAVVVVLIAIGVAYLVIHPPKLGGPPTTTTVKNTIAANVPKTTIPRNNNKSIISSIDLTRNYTGPTKIGTTNCNRATASVVYSYSKTYNALVTFYLPAGLGGLTYISSEACLLNINRIVATTPGFQVIAINPMLQQAIPAYSSKAFTIQLSVPSYNYTGPLSITVYEN
jgi:hypothetical protein